jgi:hypothetical protein
MELLFHEPPNYTFLRAFSCTCWPNLRPYNNHKLAFLSTQCVFLGYSSLYKGYKCLDHSTGHIYISRDVMFDEHLFPFASAPSASTTPPSTTTFPDREHVAYSDHVRHYRLELLATDNLVDCCSLPLSGPRSSDGSTAPGMTLSPLGANPVAYVNNGMSATTDIPPAIAGTPASSVVLVGSHALTRPDSVPHPTTEVASVPPPAESSTPASASTAFLTPSLPVDDHVALSEPVAPLATMVTCLWNNITKPRVLTDGTILYNPTRWGFFAAPSSYRVALADDQWCVAMQSMFIALQ